MKLMMRGFILFLGMLLLWQLIVILFDLPPYVLPTPTSVFKTWYLRSDIIIHESIPTFIEIILGLALGIILGCMAAIFMSFFSPARFWILPLLIISQAIPVFAIAPLLVLWLGFGMASKIITTIIMLFFPITNAFHDGLRQTNPGWLDLAKTMQGRTWYVLKYIRIPSALPHLASGIRIAAVVAPMAAIIGEWVGSSQGLGYLMLNANARMQIDLMFAALFTLIIFSLALYFIIDKCLRYIIFWQREST